MSEKTVFSPGSFFHGTKADLQTGAENRGGGNPMGRAFSGSIRQYAGKS